MWSIFILFLILVLLVVVFWLNRFSWFKGKTKWIIRYGNTIFLFLIIPLAILSLLFISLHILLVFDRTPAYLAEVTAILLGAPDDLDENRYPALLTDLIAASAFLFAAFAALQQSIGRKRLEDEVLEMHGFRVYGIVKEGVHDLRTMLKHYQNAKKLTIFAGKFDWIATNVELRDLVVDLAKNDALELISYRTMEQVKSKFENDGNIDLYEQLESHFKFESGFNEHKCTLITKQPNDVIEFLFMSPSSKDGHQFNTSVLAAQDDSRQLLQILKDLIERRPWGEDG